MSKKMQFRAALHVDHCLQAIIYANLFSGL
jgi:hypothetical protein